MVVNNTRGAYVRCRRLPRCVAIFVLHNGTRAFVEPVREDVSRWVICVVFGGRDIHSNGVIDCGEERVRRAFWERFEKKDDCNYFF